MFKTKVIPLAEVDLISGKRAIDDAQVDYEEKQEALGPKSRWQKFVASL